MFKVLTAILIGLAILVTPIVLMYVSYNNSAASFRADIADQQRKIEARFDTMWKTIAQSAEIKESYKNDFKEIWTDLIRGRYEKGAGQVMAWIKEQNPTLDSTIYTKLMTLIEAERHAFEREQGKLSQLSAAETKLYTMIPSKFFLSGEPTKIQIISSEKTKAIVESGKEDDIEIFKPKKQ
jgi:hypothetical protein